MSLIITPATKAGALFDARPELEEALMRLAPAFAQLKNPVLRKAVAKTATLEQVANTSGIDVRDLVLRLREAAGQSGAAPSAGAAAVPAGADDEANGGPRAWLHKERIRETIDATGMLERGVHPLGAVQQAAIALGAGEIVALTSGFRPQPLIDAMARAGLAVHSEETSPGSHVTYFCRLTDDPSLADRLARHSCQGGC